MSQHELFVSSNHLSENKSTFSDELLFLRDIHVITFLMQSLSGWLVCVVGGRSFTSFFAVVGQGSLWCDPEISLFCI